MGRYRCGFEQLGQYRLLDEGKRALVPVDGMFFWYLGNESKDLSRASLLQIFEAVFEAWGKALDPLVFVRTEDKKQVHIQLYFGAHEHVELDACPFAFDGKNGILAHAFPKGSGQLSGHIHFDESEMWSPLSFGHLPKVEKISPLPTASSRMEEDGIDLFQVALHEVGHVLGLGHSEIEEAIMYAFYDGIRQGLHSDDVDGVQVLYQNYLRSSFWNWWKAWWGWLFLR